jgi:glycosyltransferase involved in cell wall biosynthesis
MEDQRNPSAAGRPKLGASGQEPRRVAVVADSTDTAGGPNSRAPELAETLVELRRRAIPGYQLEVADDPTAPRHERSVTDDPTAPRHERSVIDALNERRYELVHVCTAGPLAAGAVLTAHRIGLPVVASYHHGLSTQTAIAPDDLNALYDSCQIIFSPSHAADAVIGRLGVPQERIVCWERGVDLARFSPARYAPEVLPGGFNLLYAGSLSRDTGTDLLAEAVLIARARDPRIRLVLADAGPARQQQGHEQQLRARLGTAATFLGRLDSDRLASVYATADLLVFPSTTNAAARVILEAQASGLPVLAVDHGDRDGGGGGGAAELIESGRSGCLVPAEPEALASAILGLARRETLRDRLTTGGLMAVRQRSWEHSIAQLAAGYSRAIADFRSHLEVARAA